MGSLTFCIHSSSQYSFIHGDIYYGKIPMGLFHTAAILSWETEITLFYHPNLAPEFFTARSRVVKESFFSLSAQYGCHVTKANGFDNKNIQSVFFFQSAIDQLCYFWLWELQIIVVLSRRSPIQLDVSLSLSSSLENKSLFFGNLCCYKKEFSSSLPHLLAWLVIEVSNITFQKGQNDRPSYI